MKPKMGVDQMKDPDNLPADLARRIREDHAAYFAAERARDAERLKEYQADCLASWEGRK